MADRSPSPVSPVSSIPSRLSPVDDDLDFVSAVLVPEGSPQTLELVSVTTAVVEATAAGKLIGQASRNPNSAPFSRLFLRHRLTRRWKGVRLSPPLSSPRSFGRRTPYTHPWCTLNASAPCPIPRLASSRSCWAPKLRSAPMTPPRDAALLSSLPPSYRVRPAPTPTPRAVRAARAMSVPSGAKQQTIRAGTRRLAWREPWPTPARPATSLPPRPTPLPPVPSASKTGRASSAPPLGSRRRTGRRGGGRQ